MLLSLLVACGPSELPPLATVVGPDGGRVELDGVVLDIPAGALEEPIVIQISDYGSPAARFDGLSPLWAFEPQGLPFALPVELHVPYTPLDPVPRMFWFDPDGVYAALDASFDGGVAHATIDRLSKGFVAARPVETVQFDAHTTPMDLLIVVDASSWMVEEHTRLVAAGGGLLEALEATSLDYHVGVATMSPESSLAGKLVTHSGNRFVTPSTPDAAAVFSSLLDVGTHGAGGEGRAAVYTLLELTPDIPRNHGFYREEATLDVVFVTDVEDRSGSVPVSAPEFSTWIQHEKPPERLAVAHGIVGVEQPTCALVGPGLQYLAVIEATGGEVLDVCTSDYTPLLERIVERRNQDVRVELPELPTEVVEVALLAGQASRVLASTEYTVDGAFIRFDQGVRPDPDDVVQVRFR